MTEEIVEVLKTFRNGIPIEDMISITNLMKNGGVKLRCFKIFVENTEDKINNKRMERSSFQSNL